MIYTRDQKILEEAAKRRAENCEKERIEQIKQQTLEDYVVNTRGDREQYDMWRVYSGLQERAARSEVRSVDLAGGFAAAAGFEGPDQIAKSAAEKHAGKVREYVLRRQQAGKEPFPDVQRYERRLQDDAREKRRKDEDDYLNKALCGDMDKLPDDIREMVDSSIGGDWGGTAARELTASSIVLDYARMRGGSVEKQVKRGYGYVCELAAQLKQQGQPVDMAHPAESVFKYISGQWMKDRELTAKFNSLAEKTYESSLRGVSTFDMEVERGNWSAEEWRQIQPRLAQLKAEAEHRRKRVQQYVEPVKKLMDLYIEEAEAPAMFGSVIMMARDGQRRLKGTAEAFWNMPKDDKEAVIAIIGSENGHNYLVNMLRSLNRGFSSVDEGLQQFVEGLKSLWSDDPGNDVAMRKELRDISLGHYRPVRKKEYGWFGNGTLGAVESAPMSALAFTGYGIPVMAATLAGESYGEARLSSPDGNHRMQFSGALISGTGQAGLEVFGAKVFKGVLGFTKGNAFMEKLVNNLNLERRAMALRPGLPRQTARAGVKGAIILSEGGITEKIQQGVDPFVQATFAALGDYDSGIDWERFRNDYCDREQNMEQLGSVIAFAIVGAGARYIKENPYHRKMMFQEGFLKKHFDFNEGQLREMRLEEDPEVRYELMQAGVRKFLKKKYGRTGEAGKRALPVRVGSEQFIELGKYDFSNAQKAETWIDENGTIHARIPRPSDGKAGMAEQSAAPMRPRRMAKTFAEVKTILNGLKNTMLAPKRGKKNVPLQGIPGKGLVAPGADYEVFITNKTIGKIMSGKSKDKSINPQVYTAVAANLDQLWLNSIFHEDNADSNNDSNTKTIYRREADFELNDKVYTVKLMAKGYINPGQKNAIYTLEIEGIVEKKRESNDNLGISTSPDKQTSQMKTLPPLSGNNMGQKSGQANAVGGNAEVESERISRNGGSSVLDAKQQKKDFVLGQARALEAIGLAPIREQADPKTGQKSYIVDFKNRIPEIFDTHEAAVDRLIGEMIEIEKDDIAVLRDNLAAHGNSVRKTRNEAVQSVIDNLDQEGMKAGDQKLDTSRIKHSPTVNEIAGMGGRRRDIMQARIDMWAEQEGIDQGYSGDELRGYVQNLSQVMKSGTDKAVQRIFNGSNPLDVFEERVHGIVGYLFNEGTWRQEQFEHALRQLEKATGNTYLSRTGDHLMSLQEGIGKAARENLIGKISDKKLPDLLKTWFKRLMLWFGGVVSYKKEFEKTVKIMDIDVREQVDVRFIELLQEFSGLDGTKESVAKGNKRSAQTKRNTNKKRAGARVENRRVEEGNTETSPTFSIDGRLEDSFMNKPDGGQS